jgi:hypothetical protein
MDVWDASGGVLRRKNTSVKGKWIAERRQMGHSSAASDAIPLLFRICQFIALNTKMELYENHCAESFHLVNYFTITSLSFPWS